METLIEVMTCCPPVASKQFITHKANGEKNELVAIPGWQHTKLRSVEGAQLRLDQLSSQLCSNPQLPDWDSNLQLL